MRILTLTIIVFLSVCGQATWADNVQMRDGTVIQGKYMGGSPGTIQIQAADGVKTLDTAQVLTLTFVASTAPAPAPVALPGSPQPAPVALASSQTISVPAGTILTIRLDGPVSSKDKAGTKFSGKLLADLVAD